MSGIDLTRLKSRIKESNKTIFDNNDAPWFNLKRDDNWVTASQLYVADVRLVCKPKTEGIAIRVVHNYVGWIGNEPKSFCCPRFLDPNAACIICGVAALHKDPRFEGIIVDYPDDKDGRQVIKPTLLTDLFKKLRGHKQLITTVVEPKFLRQPSKTDNKLNGVQIWTLRKQTLVSGLLALFDTFGTDYFTDPTNGRSIRVTFNKEATSGGEMYKMFPYSQEPIPYEMIEAAPDTEFYAPSVKPEADMIKKLQEMLPTVDL